MIPLQTTQFEAAVWTGKNESGADPFGDTVIVLPDTHAEKVGSIIVPQVASERQSLAAHTGLLVAVGDGAFVWTGDRTRPFSGRKPQPGDRVYFTKYAGQEIIGPDGRTYRAMLDNCIVAIKQ